MLACSGLNIEWKPIEKYQTYYFHIQNTQNKRNTWDRHKNYKWFLCLWFSISEKNIGGFIAWLTITASGWCVLQIHIVIFVSRCGNGWIWLRLASFSSGIINASVCFLNVICWVCVIYISEITYVYIYLWVHALKPLYVSVLWV